MNVFYGRCKNCANEEYCDGCYIDAEDVEAISTVLQELKHLQKENEKYISGELMTRNQAKHFEEITKKYYIHKDKIREKIEKLKPQLEETDKRTEKAQMQEERVVLKCIGIRLDERIKTLQDLLKEE